MYGIKNRRDVPRLINSLGRSLFILYLFWLLCAFMGFVDHTIGTSMLIQCIGGVLMVVKFL